MRQGIVTIVAPIRQGRTEEEVRCQLRNLRNGGLPTAPLIGLHFASLAVLGREGYDHAPHDFTPQLCFEASFDGTRESFIDDLVAHGCTWVDTVFEHCDGYPEVGAALPQVVKNYLLRHDVGADCLYIAYPYRTVGQIQHEHHLRHAVAHFDRENRAQFAYGGLPPPTQRSLVARIRQQVAAEPWLQGALTLPERPFVTTYGPIIADKIIRTVLFLLALALVAGAITVQNGFGDVTLGTVLGVSALIATYVSFFRPTWKKIGWHLWLLFFIAIGLSHYSPVAAVIFKASLYVVLSMIGLALALVLLGAAWLLAVRLHEWLLDPEPPPPSWDAHREEMLRRQECRVAQNHMVGLNTLKGGFFTTGFFRRWNVRFVLWSIHALKNAGKSGLLAGISSIHFARWVVIDQGRQVLFLVHYDGDWDAYLGDFVEQAAKGMTAIWSNCKGFPRTWFLFFGGAKDQRAFKAYARSSQQETLWVYRAYPDLTVSDIQNHTAIREALGRPQDAAGLESLLRRL
jgi:hypothetical protein